MWESRGRYTIHFCETNNRGVGIGEDKVFWHDSKKEKMQLKVSNLFIHFLLSRDTVMWMDLLMNLKSLDTQHSKVYDNSSDNSGKYYANEYMNGQKRYYYAMIKFVSDDGTIATCTAMILGFVWYNTTLGIPTPQFTGEEELSLNTIQENMAVDNNLYVVVHTASDYVSIEQLEKEFVSSFVLGDDMNCLYIAKVEAIHWSLFVFKNYGSSGKNANKLFCSLPQRRWGQYFSNKIQS
jgi:hypothetical protein